MEIQVRKLRTALDLLEPVVPKKTTLPATAYACLREGKAVGTDLNTALTVYLPEVQEPMLLSPREVLQFLTYVPGHLVAKVTRQAPGYGVSIVAGGHSAIFYGRDPADYPPIPPVQDGHEGVLDGETFVCKLMAVLPYTAKQEDRPVLTAVCLSTGESIEVAGADGFRLAWEKIPGKLFGEEKLLIPRDAVKLLDGLWKKAAVPDLQNATTPVQVALAKRPIRLTWKNCMLELRFDSVMLTVQLIQGTFPDYPQLVPSECTSSVTVMAEDMMRALLQVKHLAKESSGIVRLAWDTAELHVSARAEEVGDVTTAMGAQATVPGRVGVSFGLLRDFLTKKEGPITVSLSNGSSGPITFSRHGSANVVIMPMMVSWGDEPVKKAPKAEEPVAETTEESDVEPDEPDTQGEPESELTQAPTE